MKEIRAYSEVDDKNVKFKDESYSCNGSYIALP